jgi:acyl dehydratase
MTVTFKGIEGIKSYRGKKVGASEWHKVTQKQISMFADATEDWDWIHVDVEKAKGGPFGCTIAHGYWTLSMLIPLLRDIYRFEDIGMGLNYGIEKARFPAPVLASSSIRLHMTMKDVIDVAGGVQVLMGCEIESDKADKPVLVADILLRFYPSSKAAIK